MVALCGPAGSATLHIRMDARSSKLAYRPKQIRRPGLESLEVSRPSGRVRPAGINIHPSLSMVNSPPELT